MYPISGNVLKQANEAALYNLYLYLAHITPSSKNSTLEEKVEELERIRRKPGTDRFSLSELRQLRILCRAIEENSSLGKSEIQDLFVSERGMTAGVFVNEKGEVFVAFRGTGKGEWIDNGEGLSGIPEENTYRVYGKYGLELFRQNILLDYASDQQVNALNWFSGVASRKGWSEKNKIIVCGHSKGGNKAQFVTMHSQLVDVCYSFDGHGFSPEAISDFEDRFGNEFEKRREKIYSFSAENDYINVLGQRLMPKEQIYYFESENGIHELEAILYSNGMFRKQCDQGSFSRYMESISGKLMRKNARIRQYATLGVMNLFQIILGRDVPVNGDHVSIEKTLAGLAIAIDLFLEQIGSSQRDSNIP